MKMHAAGSATGGFVTVNKSGGMAGGSPGPDVYDVDLDHGTDDGSSVGGHQRDQRGCDDRVHDGERRHPCRLRQSSDRECGGAGNGRRRGDSSEPAALPEETDSNYTAHLKGQSAGPVVVRVASDDAGAVTATSGDTALETDTDASPQT